MATGMLLCLLPIMSHPDTPNTVPTPTAPVLCRRATSPVDFHDGSAWRHAEIIDSFAASWAAESLDDGTRTQARLLWDDEYLYFLADMVDVELISASADDGARLWLGDVFELFFKPAEDSTGYYEFQVNPAGARLNMYLPHRARDAYDRWRTSRAFAWTVYVRKSDTGWAASGRIPWSDFAPTGGMPRPGDTWRFALCRYDYTSGRSPVLSSTARLRQADFHRHEEWGQLLFVD